MTRFDCAEPFYPAPGSGTIVGSGGIWGDASDATYADSASITEADWPCAYLADPPGVRAIESVTVHLRASLISGADGRTGVYAGTTVGLGDNDLTPIVDPDGTMAGLTSTPTDFVFVSPYPSSFTNVLTGAWFVTAAPLAVRAVRIYELWFDVTFAATMPPPLRRFPTSNGAMGPVRHYPPPESRRHAGGYK